MYQIIAPTLFQNKICKMPGIGTLIMVPVAAETDFTRSEIKAPGETINFLPEENGEKIFNEFTAISELMQKKLTEEGEVFLKGIGTFTWAKDGRVSFAAIQIDPVFSQPVPVERVPRKDAEHSILVGNQETTNVQMQDLYNDTTTKSRWWIVALILGAIGIGLLLFYLYHYGFSELGNTHPL